MKAALQSVFQDLIEDDFFITVTNGLTDIINLVDLFIDSVGGLPGLLATIAALATSLLGDKMVAGLQNAQMQLSKILKPKGSDATYAELEGDRIAAETMKAAIDMRKQSVGGDSIQNDLVLDNLETQLKLFNSLRDLRGKITEQEFNSYKQQINNTGEYAKQLEIINSQVAALRQKSNLAKASVRDKVDAMDENSPYKKEAEEFIQGGYKEPLADVLKMPELDQAQGLENVANSYDNLRQAMSMTREEFLNFLQIEMETLSGEQKRANVADAETKSVENLTKALEVENEVAEIQAKLKKDNANLDDLIANAVSNLTAEETEETQALKDNIAALQAQRKERQLSANAYKANITKNNNKIEKLETEVAEKKDQMKAADSEVERTGYYNEIAAKEREIAELKAKNKDYQNEINSLKAEENQINEDLKADEQELANITEKREAAAEKAIQEKLNPPKVEDNSKLDRKSVV